MALSEILAAIPPVSFMVDYFLAASIRETGGVLSGNVPGGERMRCIGNGFFAEYLSGSRMVGGSVVDILAAIHLRSAAQRRCNMSGLDAYKTAVTELVDKYAESMPHGADDPNVLLAAAAEAYERRKIYTLVLGTRMDDYNSDHATRKLLGTVPHPPPGCGSVLDRTRTKELKAILEKIDDKIKLADAPSVVLAWMADAATIACIEVFQSPPGGKSTQHTVWLQPYTYGILGLPRLVPGIPVQIESSYKLFCRQRVENACMILDNKKGTIIPYVPNDAVCTDNPDCSGALRLVPLHTAGCRITVDSGAGGITTWAARTVENVMIMLKEDGRVTDRVRTLLETVRSVPGVRDMLFSRLESAAMFEAVQALRYYFRKSVLFGSKGRSLFLSPSGFVVETDKTGVAEPVTNFTFSPLHSVRFSMKDIHFYGTLSVKGDSRVIHIPDCALDSVKKFIDNIKDACALNFEQTTAVPTVFDTRDAKLILDWLVRSYSNKPQYPGTNVLGWDGSRKSYYGVEFVAGESGCRSVPVYLHPSIRYFDYFARTGMQSDTPDNLPGPLKDVCYKCAAMLARSFHCRPMCPVLLRSNLSTDTTMQTVFTLLGQKCTVRLNPNMRENGDIAAFQGYPVLATGYNAAQASAVTTSVVLLGDFGTELPDCSMEAAVAAGRYLKYVCEELPVALLKGAPVEFESSVSEDVLLAEGKRLISMLEARTSTATPAKDSTETALQRTEEQQA